MHNSLWQCWRCARPELLARARCPRQLHYQCLSPRYNALQKRFASCLPRALALLGPKIVFLPRKKTKQCFIADGGITVVFSQQGARVLLKG